MVNDLLLDLSVEVILDLVLEQLVRMEHLVHQQTEQVEDMLDAHQETVLDHLVQDSEVALVEETVENLEWEVLNQDLKDQKVVLDSTNTILYKKRPCFYWRGLFLFFVILNKVNDPEEYTMSLGVLLRLT